MDLKHQVTWGSSRARSGGCWGVTCVLIWSRRYISPKPGIVWETYHQGVPLLGVPENPNDFLVSKALKRTQQLKKAPWMEVYLLLEMVIFPARHVSLLEGIHSFILRGCEICVFVWFFSPLWGARSWHHWTPSHDWSSSPRNGRPYIRA